jgi:hypothetical protein
MGRVRLPVPQAVAIERAGVAGGTKYNIPGWRFTPIMHPGLISTQAVKPVDTGIRSGSHPLIHHQTREGGCIFFALVHHLQKKRTIDTTRGGDTHVDHLGISGIMWNGVSLRTKDRSRAFAYAIS